MLPFLAQLSSDEIGVIRAFVAILSTLFLGVIGWVGWYMRRTAERVDAHVTEIALLKKDVENIEDQMRRLWRHRGRSPEESHE